MTFNPVPKPMYQRKKSPKSIPKDLRKGIRSRDGDTCRICGDKADSMHHIVSSGMSRRKVHVKENLILVCFKCHHEIHSGKFSEELQEFCMEFSRKKYGNVIDKIKDATKKGKKWEVR